MGIKHKGFTIVELLVVIVVIGILAAIVIIAYNGVQQRARASNAVAALTQANKKIKLWQVDNSDSTPPTLATVGVSNTNEVTYQYSPGTSGSYCITATNGNVSYKTTESSQPTSGGCPGHGQGGVAAITNLSTNPSVESNTTGFSAANSATISRTNGAAIDGSWGLQVVSPASGPADSGVNLGVPSSVTAGQARSYSVKIKAVTAGTYSLSLQGSATGGSQPARPTITLSAGQTGTLSISYTAAATGSIVLYVLRTNTAAYTYYIDSVMITDGTAINSYSDGDSNNWVWNGTPDNSSSTGPA